MNKIVIFAGTTEGRRLAECLAASGIHHTVCVATEYGEYVLKDNPYLEVHCGRMQEDQIKDFLQNGGFDAVVDATHPYAELVTENIKAAMEDMNIPYLRLKRETEQTQKEDRVVYFATNEACARALEEMQGNILLTTGSKELNKYCISEELKQRLFVRILPGRESLALCTEQGIRGKQILAMQGPFSTELNEAIIRQYGITCLVTKESGASGGYYEKLAAAKKTGIYVYVIGREPEEKGFTFREVCRELEDICKKKICLTNEMEITLAGIGMGSANCLTKEVLEKIREADILLGAERMLEEYSPGIEKKPFYLAGQIIPYLYEMQEKYPLQKLKTVVLFSGDSGFYSGCASLYQALQKEKNAGRLHAGIQIMPGISSVAYLSSLIGESYQDAAVYSLHGKEIKNLAKRIRTGEKTFLLVSGVKDINRLGEILLKAGMEECEITTGYQLSYAEQRIAVRTPLECTQLKEEGLYTCFIRNPSAEKKRLTHGMGDETFCRDAVPMTKEEIREVSICKLRLHQGAVVYDIGSGTGSVSVEIAELSPDIQVFAIEEKAKAVSLIRRNKEKFQLDNLTILETKAPENLRDLPMATHAFIGGSGGRLKEILQELYERNPDMRIVINAVSLETICRIRELLATYPVKNEEIIQMQISRAKEVGNYHLMQAENPVWICSFNFCRE